VHSALWGVVFCLDFSPFFFFSSSLVGCVFFIYLFIYLKIRNSSSETTYGKETQKEMQELEFVGCQQYSPFHRDCEKVLESHPQAKAIIVKLTPKGSRAGMGHMESSYLRKG
jgi:hypothetical protein